VKCFEASIEVDDDDDDDDDDDVPGNRELAD
jgi:hypothetical protein